MKKFTNKSAFKDKWPIISMTIAFLILLIFNVITTNEKKLEKAKKNRAGIIYIPMNRSGSGVR